MLSKKPELDPSDQAILLLGAGLIHEQIEYFADWCAAMRREVERELTTEHLTRIYNYSKLVAHYPANDWEQRVLELCVSHEDVDRYKNCTFCRFTPCPILPMQEADYAASNDEVSGRISISRAQAEEIIRGEWSRRMESSRHHYLGLACMALSPFFIFILAIPFHGQRALWAI